MTVRACLFAALLLAALAGLTGCGGNEAAPLPAETDEPLYVQGLQLKKVGRETEALVSFLKLIEKRGEHGAPESHLEAGLVYSRHIKKYIKAIHHFEEYIALRPNSPQATGVRDLIKNANREYARTLPAIPPDQFSVGSEVASAKLEQLQRENEELRAELAAHRGGGQPISRPSRTTAVNLPQQARATVAEDSPLTLTPMRGPAPDRPVLTPTVVQGPPATVPTRVVAPPARGGGRTHAVEPSDSLWKIGRRYYGNNVAAAKVQAIFEANRDQMKNEGDLRVGMALRIP